LPCLPTYSLLAISARHLSLLPSRYYFTPPHSHCTPFLTFFRRVSVQACQSCQSSDLLSGASPRLIALPFPLLTLASYKCRTCVYPSAKAISTTHSWTSQLFASCPRPASTFFGVTNRLIHFTHTSVWMRERHRGPSALILRKLVITTASAAWCQQRCVVHRRMILRRVCSRVVFR
jgi:hypothetical protein